MDDDYNYIVGMFGMNVKRLNILFVFFIESKG